VSKILLHLYLTITHSIIIIINMC